jgi:hypothetical protein
VTRETDSELAAALAAVRYREEKISLYRAKMYRGGAATPQGLRERERARDGAIANLRRLRERRAEEEHPPASG